MTATEARELNYEAESVDNTDVILRRIEHAAKQRKHGVEVNTDLMTARTAARLNKLGYWVQRRTRPAPTRHNWNANETYYLVSW